MLRSNEMQMITSPRIQLAFNVRLVEQRKFLLLLLYRYCYDDFDEREKFDGRIGLCANR